MIVTGYFRIPPGKYVRQALSIWFGRWWWCLVVPLLALIFAGMYDVRMYIVALALALVVYPGLMSLVYFNYALRPEAALSILMHRVTFGADGIIVDYQQEDGRRTPGPKAYGLDSISHVEDTGRSLLIHLASGRYDFIEVPAEVFPAGDFSKALVLFSTRNIDA